MDQLGILLKLKDLLKDTCGRQAISCLIQYPLICDYIKGPANLQKVVDRLGNESQLWSPLNICKIAAGDDIKSSPSNNPLLSEYFEVESTTISAKLQPIEKINTLGDIYQIAEKIASIGKKNSWLEIFEQLCLGSYSFTNPKKILETIFAVVYELVENRNKLINELLDYSVQDSGPKLLAHLLMMNISISNLLIDSLEMKTLKPSIENFVSFLIEMHFLGDQNFRVILARKFTEVYPYDDKTSENNEFKTLADDLSKLQYLKNYSALFKILGDEKGSERISLTAKEVLSSVGQKLGFKSNIEEINIQNRDEKNMGSNLYGIELIHEISRIKNIAQTDFDSAITIAHEFSRKLLSAHDIGSLIFNRDLGFLIEPEDLVQVFSELGSFVQANAILIKLLKQWPQNILLLRMAANLSHDKGNHRGAISLYSQLDVLDSLSREEKIKFASSLEYSDLWGDAFEIRKGINTIDDKDITDFFLCAYYAGNIEAQKELIINNRQWIQSSALSSLLLEITEEDKDKIDSISEQLASSDFSNENDQKGFLLVADYFYKIGEINKAVRILEESAKNSSYSYSIVNRLYFYFQKMGESEKSRLILENNSENACNDQKSFEIYIKNLIKSGEIDKAEQLLKMNFDLWELSPCKIDLSAKIFIEKRKFLEGKKVLHSLLENDDCDAECKFDYCLASLECSSADFPFGINIENSNINDEIKKLLDFEHENIFFELLEAELDCDKRFEKYQQLMQKYSKNNNSDAWRIFAGLGRIYFELKQYDSAIINIKHAYRTMPNNVVLFWLLIRCYANLQLWNEIEALLNNRLILDNLEILNGFRNFRVLSENSDWPRFLENQVQKKPEEIIYKILLAQAFVESGRKFDASELVKSFYEKLIVENNYYLFCVQILIDSNEILLAERLIEIFLTNKKTPDEIDYLSCAFLYYQSGKLEKSLAMMNHLEYHDLAFLTFKAKLLNALGKIGLSQKLINQVIDHTYSEEVNINNMSVRIPDSVKTIHNNPALAYLEAAFSAIRNKDIEKAITILENGMKKYPESPEIIFNILDLLNITGMNEKAQSLMETHTQTLSEIQSPSLLCLLGEIALSNKEEVTCAKYLSEALKLEPENPRIKALQVRMLTINGNILEAQNVFNSVIKEINIKNQISEDKSASQLETGTKLWLANAALEVKDYEAALRVSQQEINDFGYFTPISNIFLSALSEILEHEFLLNEIKSNRLANPIKEEIKNTFSVILDKNVSAQSNNKEQNDSLVKCQLFLENNSETYPKAEELEPETKNINSIIFATFKTKGQEAAEIAFNSFKTNSNHELFIAILERDSSPENALRHLKKVNNSGTPDARCQALLAIIEKNMGNLADAYAAISLALDQCPDEYEWQIMAGDLSKAVGDLHASLTHYEKAQGINLKMGLDKNIEALYFYMETEDAIPILEKQLLQNPNKDQLIQLGKIYLKYGNYRKAVNVFETAIKQYPRDAISYYWLSEIALKLNNSGKALDNIEKALAFDSSNSQYICKKTIIVSKVFGYSQAINFIDSELAKRNNNKDELFISKIRLISENEDDKTALWLLNSINDLQESPILLLEKAKLEFRLGNLSESESIAEKLLNQKDYKADALFLLGLITKARGEFDRAIDFYVKAIELNPLSSEKFIHLAEIYHDKKDFKQALETLEDGIKTNPGSFNLLYKSGLYYYQHGLYNEAGKRIKEAIRIEPDHRDSKELLGLLENVMANKTKSIVTQFAE